MLPAEARLRTPEDFRSVVRGGVRVARETVVVHALASSGPPSRAGFVVSRAVGGAVVRNRVKRRLRHLVADRFRTGGRPVDVVVRALPPAASGPLPGDFGRAWDTAMTRLGSA